MDGSFEDDIGLIASGAFAKVYQTDQHVAIMAANLTEDGSTFQFDFDVSRYGVETESYSLIASNGGNEEKIAARKERTLSGSTQLAPFEMAALIFKKQ